ncbi:uncharacterized protein N7473_009846 [Penicillium subrubescens]|uniref:uncharacterized protein n=1 Tax=Penicillium subrubescens TaxID=1316194 RepID=UPI0025453149|nr:uncharacterized protein N7473_009846 [Penicillium subrubescens]KAJ5882960.1 hypothetical protein N7473_009846 [Penicillium subrubescens]
MHFKTGFVVDAEYDAGSALSAAISRGHIEVVRALIDHGLNWGSIARIHEEGYLEPEVPGTDHQYTDPVKLALSLGAKIVSPTTKAIVRELKNAAFESSGYANNLTSPATPVDQVFTATKVQVGDDTRVSWKQLPVSELLQNHKILDGDDKITWIHLSANNVSQFPVPLTT